MNFLRNQGPKKRRQASYSEDLPPLCPCNLRDRAPGRSAHSSTQQTASPLPFGGPAECLSSHSPEPTCTTPPSFCLSVSGRVAPSAVLRLSPDGSCDGWQDGNGRWRAEIGPGRNRPTLSANGLSAKGWLRRQMARIASKLRLLVWFAGGHLPAKLAICRQTICRRSRPVYSGLPLGYNPASVPSAKTHAFHTASPFHSGPNRLRHCWRTCTRSRAVDDEYRHG